ncbi:MAG: YbaB/EbfC family nucleoid-associated protein [Actinomycetota bacterium]|jgi:nucleoid-associated protein EbfC|nr:YbaB/EbfC family nucleoid-associated protein [Actinomycetota bacterium]
MSEQPDLGALLKQAQDMQQQLMAAQSQAAAVVVEGQAGGGMVKVTMTAGGEVQGVSIAPEVVDPADVEMLEDLVTAAIRDALAKGGEAQSAAMDLGGGLDLGGLGNLLG